MSQNNIAAHASAATHYENFPVASWLCPPPLRPAVAAIYAFARTADDIADEGNAPAQSRLEELTLMRADLLALGGGQHHSGRWPGVFDPLSQVLVKFGLPVSLLMDLLSAFEQDVANTRDGALFRNQTELQDYCRRSANPVGRLMLHLYGIHDDASLTLSDDICSALQLINFWQDLSVDLPRGRYYLPLEDCARFNLTPDDLTDPIRRAAKAERFRELVAERVKSAKAMMLSGAPLAKRIPGRAGWELRLVVQGGLRIIDKIEASDFATLTMRPSIAMRDAPLMLWRALWM